MTSAENLDTKAFTNTVLIGRKSADQISNLRLNNSLNLTGEGISAMRSFPFTALA